MCKKLSYVLSLMLLLSLAGNAFASGQRFGKYGPVDGDWFNLANWDSTFIPGTGTGGSAQIFKHVTVPLTGDPCDLALSTLNMGADITVDGAIVTMGNINGLDVGAGLWPVAGNPLPEGPATLTIHSGRMEVLNSLAHIWVGRDLGEPTPSKDGVIQMNGGELISAGTLILGDDGSFGQVNLAGGTITVAGALTIDNGYMVVSGGELILGGDQLAAVEGYIASGDIAGSGPGTLLYAVIGGDTVVKMIDFVFNETPEDNTSVDHVTTSELTWDLPDPSGANPVKCDVRFGTDPVIGNNPLVVTNQAVTSWTIAPALLDNTSYYWQITVYDSVIADEFNSNVFRFDTGNTRPYAKIVNGTGPASRKADATWMPDGGGNAAYQLDSTGSHDGGDGPDPLSYDWIISIGGPVYADPNNPTNPPLSGAWLDDATAAHPVMNIPEAGQYQVKLTVWDGSYKPDGSQNLSITRKLTLAVYEDSCEHAAETSGQGEAFWAPGDANRDCLVDASDLQAIAETWLNDRKSTEFTYDP